MYRHTKVTKEQFLTTRLWGIHGRRPSISFEKNKGGRLSGGVLQCSVSKKAPNLYKSSYIGIEKMELINEADRMIRETKLVERIRNKRREDWFGLLTNLKLKSPCAKFQPKFI